jgi:REP element-mobilizing transposase RayT
MPRPLRDDVLPPDESCFAHLYNRCVQGTYLCGVDHATGKDYSHRKKWIVQRLEQLASVYLIDILAFAVLDNHLHVVVRTLPDEVKKLTDRQVAIRWLSLHPGWLLDEFVCVEPTEAQIKQLLADPEKIEQVRRNLSSPSTFMKDLCEPIAKRANKEDGRKGHFWEDRFQAQRLMDILAILVCVAYVDLNLIRAAMASSLVGSNFTSIQARILGSQNQMAPSLALGKVSICDVLGTESIKDLSKAEIRRRIKAARKQAEKQMVLRDAWIAKLTIDANQSVNPNDSHLSKSGLRASDRGFLHVTLEQYIKILAESLRFRPGNASMQEPSEELMEVSKTLGVAPDNIRWMISDYKRIFRRSCRVGNPESMRKEAQRRGRKWTKYSRHSELFYSKKSVEFDVENGRFRRAKIRVSTSESGGKSTAS